MVVPVGLFLEFKLGLEFSFDSVCSWNDDSSEVSASSSDGEKESLLGKSVVDSGNASDVGDMLKDEDALSLD